jgi:hypothetical protein
MAKPRKARLGQPTAAGTVISHQALMFHRFVALLTQAIVAFVHAFQR